MLCIARSVFTRVVWIFLSCAYLLGILTSTASGQVPHQDIGHKVWAVVPLIGNGTSEDPTRPMFTPSPAEAEAEAQAREAAAIPDPGDPTGQRMVLPTPDLLGFAVLGTEQHMALVEFRFLNPLGFRNFLVKAAAQRQVVVARGGKNIAVIDLDKMNRGEIENDDLDDLEGAKSDLCGALEAAIPGMKFLERGKTTEAEIVTEFRKVKSTFVFPHSVRTTEQAGGAQ